MDEIGPYLPGILTAYTVFMIGIFSPGPNILAVIGTSMAVGRRPGLALAMGVASGSLCWGVMAWLGLTAVLTAYATLMTAIKVIGAAYLLWLAMKAFRSAATPGQSPLSSVSVTGGAIAYYRRGLLVQMTNPKAALSWVAVIALGLSPEAPWWVGGIIVGGTAVLSFVGHSAYALLFSTAPMVAAYRRTRRWIEFALGAFFCFASYKLLTART
jgi:threonine/homoserine/homoserine lactone efflux protein